MLKLGYKASAEQFAPKPLLVEKTPGQLFAELDKNGDGKLTADGVFHATKVQAKCASKYEAKPTGSITRG